MHSTISVQTDSANMESVVRGGQRWTSCNGCVMVSQLLPVWNI